MILLIYLRKPEFAERCSINSLITVVDSMNYLEQCEVFGEFFEDQIANASTLVLSKSQFVDEEKIAEIISSLRDLNIDANLITADWNALKMDDFYSLLQGDLLWILRIYSMRNIDPVEKMNLIPLQ